MLGSASTAKNLAEYDERKRGFFGVLGNWTMLSAGTLTTVSVIGAAAYYKYKQNKGEQQ
tara:strand:+ start:1812 stop:1988 length:177 start_codon:yes stop_codon:yes gene_type:complete